MNLRYVTELTKMKKTFIDPLLYPFYTTSPQPDTSLGAFLNYDEYLRSRTSETFENLPITSRFLVSPVAGRSTTPAPPSTKSEGTPYPEISGGDVEDDLAEHNHPHSSYNTTANQSGRSGGSLSHPRHSFPPRMTDPAESTQSLVRQTLITDDGLSTKGIIQTQGPKVLRKAHKNSNFEPAPVPGVVPPRQLPDDLRICLEVIESDLLEGHVRLSEALKNRYEEQYPLVRSLSDVFISNVCSFVAVCLSSLIRFYY